MSESKTILLDIGNTRLKWGVLSDGCISRTGSIDHVTLQEKGFAALTTRLPTKVDHVIASNDLTFQVWTDPDAEISPYEVEVTGWNQIEDAAARTAFIRNVSDHCSLFVEVL